MTGAQPGLRRALGLPALAAYGIGGMLGGGIYALVGEVAGLAGTWSWLCFVLAMAVAAPTALTYAELVARHPRSGGEAWYSKVAFGGEAIPLLTGWLVLFSGIVSMAALARAFAGYVQEVVPSAPAAGVLAVFLATLALLNLRGIQVASVANVICTVVEVSGLAAVILIGTALLSDGGPRPEPADPAAFGFAWGQILQGAALAFYAFIGFEDMVNVAEEVRRPQRAYPIAIPLALLCVGVLYALVSFVATAVVAPGELASSAAPLTRVVSRGGDGIPAKAFSLVALFAVANSALLNFVMASRLAYGMAREGLLPGWLAAVHRSWRTPSNAIASILVVAIAAASSGGVAFLAGATSLLLLLVFFTMNLALVRIRRRQRDAESLRSPGFVPWIGMLFSAGLALFLPPRSIAAALTVVAAGVLLVAVQKAIRSRTRSDDRTRHGGC